MPIFPDNISHLPSAAGDPPRVIVRAEPLYRAVCEEGERPPVTGWHGRYGLAVEAVRAPEARYLYEIQVVAFLDGKEIGHVCALAVDLKRYGCVDDFLEDADIVSSTALEAAYKVASYGADYWSSRGVLVFIDTAQVHPDHRRRGLLRAMAAVLLAKARRARRSLDMILQPYPIDYEHVAADKASGRTVISRSQWDAELEGVARCWRAVFPFLGAAGRGTVTTDRIYYLGRCPAPSRRIASHDGPPDRPTPPIHAGHA